MVLAAGAGKRLGPETAELPKTLLPVDGDRTILDVALGNFAAVGLEEAVVITGYQAQRIEERVGGAAGAPRAARRARLQPARSTGTTRTRCGARASTSPAACCSPTATRCTPRRCSSGCSTRAAAPTWCSRSTRRSRSPQEEMKVHVTGDGLLDRINKALDPATAQGEYIGVTLIEPGAADALADALQATFERDRQLYYEDGFQELADRGGRVGIAPIGAVEWVEVDDATDLARAREVACRC